MTIRFAMTLVVLAASSAAAEEPSFRSTAIFPAEDKHNHASCVIELPGGDLPPGEGRSYTMEWQVPALGFAARPLEAAVNDYVDWLRRHPAAQGRTRA